MKDVHDNLLPTDSAYYRARYPDSWFWGDIQTRLAGKIATAVEKLVFLTASQYYAHIPEVYRWAEYGPSITADDDSEGDREKVVAAEQRARDIAAAMRR